MATSGQCLVVSATLVGLAVLLAWAGIKETSNAFAGSVYNSSECDGRISAIRAYQITPLVVGISATTLALIGWCVLGTLRLSLSAMAHLANETERCARTTVAVLWIMTIASLAVLRIVLVRCFETPPPVAHRLAVASLVASAVVPLVWLAYSSCASLTHTPVPAVEMTTSLVGLPENDSDESPPGSPLRLAEC